MKKLFVYIILSICAISSFAQSVSYTYRPLAAEGCNVKYSASWQNGKPFIVVNVRSDRMKFTPEPVLMFKTVDDDVLKLEGTSLDVSSQSAGIVSGNVVIPIQEFNASAQFSISEEQIALLNKGIKKVRISLVPMNHERDFKKDKIGKKLYKAFMESKKLEDDF